MSNKIFEVNEIVLSDSEKCLIIGCTYKDHWVTLVMDLAGRSYCYWEDTFKADELKDVINIETVYKQTAANNKKRKIKILLPHNDYFESFEDLLEIEWVYEENPEPLYLGSNYDKDNQEVKFWYEVKGEYFAIILHECPNYRRGKGEKRDILRYLDRNGSPIRKNTALYNTLERLLPLEVAVYDSLINGDYRSW